MACLKRRFTTPMSMTTTTSSLGKMMNPPSTKLRSRRGKKVLWTPQSHGASKSTMQPICGILGRKAAVCRSEGESAATCHSWPYRTTTRPRPRLLLVQQRARFTKAQGWQEGSFQLIHCSLLELDRPPQSNAFAVEAQDTLQQIAPSCPRLQCLIPRRFLTMR